MWEGVIVGKMMRGEIDAAIKVQCQANGLHLRAGAICRKTADQRMGKFIGVGMNAPDWNGYSIALIGMQTPDQPERGAQETQLRRAGGMGERDVLGEQ